MQGRARGPGKILEFLVVGVGVKHKGFPTFRDCEQAWGGYGWQLLRRMEWDWPRGRGTVDGQVDQSNMRGSKTLAMMGR